MAELGIALLSFVVSLALYGLMVRRRGSLRAALLPLLLPFAVVPVIVVLGTALLRPSDPIDAALLACSIAWSLLIAFIVANTAIETESPTQSLVLFIWSKRTTGAPAELITEFDRSRPYRDSRLHGLLNDGLVRLSNGRYVCTGSGTKMIAVLDAYRRLIGRRTPTG
ncbi:MAG TPA: hypothetical protein VNR11_21255 [Xanthobacteraceae bacterium]|nr:hypothetical protein [Xanthobacteraceae bacterium]